MSRAVSAITGCMILAGVIVSSAYSENYQAMAIQNAALYGERVEASQDVRDHYLSKGQEYLREYLREQMISKFGAQWMQMDLQAMQAGVAVDLERFIDNKQLPLQAQMRVYADEDLNSYLNCGRFLPVEVEMDSSYYLIPKLQLKAKIEAPFDDVMRFEVGSQIDWTRAMHSTIQYHLRNGSEMYDGVTLGMGMYFNNWRCRVNYEITNEYEHIQHISVASDF